MFGKLKLMSVATFLAFVSGAFAADGKPTGTLPVVYINTEDSKPIVEKEEKIPATIWIDAAGTDYESLGSAETPVAFTVSGRGNYSWVGFDKKPYKVKFDLKTSVLGMPKNKTFALLAHADDNLAFLRNAMGFELSKRMGLAWTPTQIPVELVLNGEYRGLYFFAETIKVDKNRVNITEQDEPAPAGADVTGGWLVEIDNYDSDPHVTVDEPGYGPIWFTYKSPEVLSAEQEAYLTNQIKAIMDAIYVEDKNSTEWEKYIDIDAAARYYIVQEILDDCESYHGSCYLHKDQGADAKWKFGPVWDFGNAYQRPSKNWVWQSLEFHQVWIGELCKFPRFMDKVREVWKGYAENNANFQKAYVDNYINSIREAAKADAERWPQYGNSDPDSRASSFLGFMNNSVSWLGERLGTVVEPAQAIYLRGEFNGWGLSKQMQTTDNVTYTIYMDELSGEFKFATEDWKTIDLGTPDKTPVVPGKIIQLTAAGKNISLASPLKDCRLTLNIKDKTLLIEDKTLGIGETLADKGITISGRTIKCSGAIRVFDAAGTLVVSGDDCVTVAKPGCYIIQTLSADSSTKRSSVITVIK